MWGLYPEPRGIAERFLEGYKILGERGTDTRWLVTAGGKSGLHTD